MDDGSPRTASHLPTVSIPPPASHCFRRVRKEHARGLCAWSTAHFSGVFCPQEKLALRQQLDGVRQQLAQQAEYCTEMGAATCTLLWGVSSSEDVVKAMLGGVSTAGPGVVVVPAVWLRGRRHAVRLSVVCSPGSLGKPTGWGPPQPGLWGYESACFSPGSGHCLWGSFRVSAVLWRLYTLTAFRVLLHVRAGSVIFNFLNVTGSLAHTC